ncbi:MAG: DUF485 domain-containing protein [Chloroflexi bacterium]|nr:DUF485 domain-containing protein [Chloroflexota bacterium]
MADTKDRAPFASSGDDIPASQELEKEKVIENLEEIPEFQQLEKSKARFIIPATIFFLVYYFALPVLVGFFPDTMDTRLFSGFSVAYLFALSQFFMAWILAFLYLLYFAPKIDQMVRNIIKAVEARHIKVSRKGGR